MWSAIENLKIRLSLALTWRSPERVASAIRGFQVTEADGVWHLHRAIERLEDPRTKAVIFTHGLEEECHADVFGTVQRLYAGGLSSPMHFERKDLYAADDPAWKIFAFVNVGELDATQRFRLLRGALPEGPLRDALKSIIDDEEGHVHLTYDMLRRMGASPGEIRVEFVKVRLSRAWEAWLRVGKRMVDGLATVLLSLVYYLLGPFVARAARRRLEHRVVEFDSAHLKHL